MRLPGAIRRVGHGDHLTVVGHLDELRARIIVSLLAVTVAFGICFWQNDRLLHLVDTPLAHETQQQVRAGHGPLGIAYRTQRDARDIAVQLRTVTQALSSERHGPQVSAALSRVQTRLQSDVASLSAPPQGDRPVTLGIGEPLTTTLTVTLIFALILSLPVVLLQAYAFLIPAVAPAERGRLRPLLAAIPLLFIAGVAFGYFAVLPAAVRFFQNFNSDQFNVLVQASSYYKFAATTVLAMGLLFQVPVGILAVTRAGVITPRQLRRNRRYAIAVCAAVAALLPGDAMTMLIETVPLYLLFEVSVFVSAIVERRARRRSAGVRPAVAAHPSDS